MARILQEALFVQCAGLKPGVGKMFAQVELARRPAVGKWAIFHPLAGIECELIHRPMQLEGGDGLFKKDRQRLAHERPRAVA